MRDFYQSLDFFKNLTNPTPTVNVFFLNLVYSTLYSSLMLG